jgi:hypothetical protein
MTEVEWRTRPTLQDRRGASLTHVRGCWVVDLVLGAA